MFSQILLSFAVGGLCTAVAGIAIKEPTITTENPISPTVIKREEKIATITLGDISQYVDYQGDDKVDKRSVAIFPTGIVEEIPPHGIQVAIGPELQESVDTTAKEHCTDASRMQTCVEEIHRHFQDSSLSTHTKRFILISAFTVGVIIENVVAAAFGAIAGVALAAGVTAVSAPEAVKFEDTSDSGVLAQVHSLQDASLVAIATGTNNEVMATITVSVAPTPTQKPPEEKVRIEEVTQDTDNDKKGDILIHIPDPTASRLLDLLGIYGLDRARRECKDGRPRLDHLSTQVPRAPPVRSPECEREVRDLLAAMLAAEEGQTLALVPANPENPMNPAVNERGAAAPNFNFQGAQIVLQEARRRLAGENHNRRLVEQTIQAISIMASIVVDVVVEMIEIQNRVLVIKLALSEIQRIMPEDVACPNDLVCLEDNCKGWMMENSPYFEFDGKQTKVQTGICKESNGCYCEEVIEPFIYEVEGEDYFDELAKWAEELKKDGPEASCDTNNKIRVGPKQFKESADSACNNHDELKRRSKRGGGSWDWDKVEDLDGNNLQWSFNWNDKGDQCEMDCRSVFQIFQEDRKCIWDDGMSRAGFIETECGIASYTVDEPYSPDCWDWPHGAPRGRKEIDEEGVSGTSVEDALEQFCNDIDGQRVDPEREHSRRWGFAEWGVSDRRSFWLRAQYAARPTCQGYEWPHKTNCKAALKQGMQQCSASHGRTGGFILEGIGCIDYSIHVTDNIFDDSPPWKDPVLRFPPPLNAPKKGGGSNDVICNDGPSDRPLTDEDLYKAIDAFCQNGKDIDGFGDDRNPWSKMFHYPPDGQPLFYGQGKEDSMRLNIGAETVNNGAPQPYENMDQCKNYDWKLGKDDCTYALRKLHKTCTASDGGLLGGDFTYRCVHYKSWAVNVGK